MQTLKRGINTLPVLESDRRFEIETLHDLTVLDAEDLIYRLGFTAKDIAMHTKSAPSTKEVAAKLREMSVSPIRLTTEDYEYAKDKHVKRLRDDKSFDVQLVRKRLLEGLVSPSELQYEYNIPHRKTREILCILIEDYDKISRKCSSMRAISRANSKSKKFQMMESNDSIRATLSDAFEINCNTSANYLFDLREKIEYDFDAQKDVLKEYRRRLDRVIRYPEDEIFEAIEFRLPNKIYLQLRDEGIVDFDNSIFYRPMSKHEEDVLSTIREFYDGEVVINDRKILHGKELDFYMPDLNLAVEVNPIFTHNSNLYRNNHNGWRHDDRYHFEKYLNCKDQGVELIQLQQYDLEEDRFNRFTKNLLKSKLSDRGSRVYARDTVFKEIATSDAKNFMIENHRDGYAQASRKFGLFLNEDLVAVATVSKDRSRFNRKGDFYEIVRLAFKSDVTVVGGLSKIVKNLFESIEDMSSLVTFSDNDYGSGKSYESAGFTFISETGARLRYISTTDPANDRYSWMIAKGFDHSNNKTVIARDANSKKLQVNDPEEYIEIELSHRTDNEKGYNRMFTSGSKKWKIERSDVL